MSYFLVTEQNTRADKETRYEGFNGRKLHWTWKEEASIDLIKYALSKSKKPAVSVSFGVDSILQLYLIRKALVELGRSPSDIDVVWNDTANEFKEVRQFAKQITDQWNLRLITTKPKKTLKHIIADNGGLTSDYFVSRKGDRRQGVPLSEKCCNTLKHEPMKRVMKENGYDLIFVGLRADESSQRLFAGLRDGEYFYSKALWKSFVCRPILWWNHADVWEYMKEFDIPYNALYDMTVQKENGKTFTPRTGCMMCPIPIKYGYLQWMRTYYPKVYDAMIYNLGYGKALISLVPDEVKKELAFYLGQEIDEHNVSEHLKEILEYKPCTFDQF